MLRRTCLHSHVALIALLATLLLALVPTVGRVLASETARAERVEASQAERDLLTGLHGRHVAAPAEGDGPPAPMPTADACGYCVLLGSLVQPSLPTPLPASPPAAREPLRHSGSAPAVVRPLSTLGSRGPPGCAA